MSECQWQRETIEDELVQIYIKVADSSSAALICWEIRLQTHSCYYVEKEIKHYCNYNQRQLNRIRLDLSSDNLHKSFEPQKPYREAEDC